MRNPWQMHGMETKWEFDWNVAIALPFGKMLKFGKAAAKFGPVLRAMKKVAQTKAATALSEATKKIKDAKSLQQIKSIIQAASKNLKLGPGEWEKIHDGLKSTLQANKELGELDPTKGATPVIIDLPIGAGAELSIFMKQLRMSVSMVSGGGVSPASPDAPAK